MEKQQNMPSGYEKNRKIIGKYKPFFKLNHFKIIGEQPYGTENFSSTAVINITVDGP